MIRSVQPKIFSCTKIWKSRCLRKYSFETFKHIQANFILDSVKIHHLKWNSSLLEKTISSHHIAVITIILCMIGVNFCSIISSMFAWSRFLIKIHKYSLPKYDRWLPLIIFWTFRIMISKHFLNILHLILLVYFAYFHQRWKAVDG